VRHSNTKSRKSPPCALHAIAYGRRVNICVSISCIAFLSPFLAASYALGALGTLSLATARGRGAVHPHHEEDFAMLPARELREASLLSLRVESWCRHCLHRQQTPPAKHPQRIYHRDPRPFDAH
jgi:hypothetical protein